MRRRRLDTILDTAYLRRRALEQEATEQRRRLHVVIDRLNSALLRR